MDALGALEVSSAAFTRTLRQVETGEWAAPTPNAGWSVRDLVNHVVGATVATPCSSPAPPWKKSRRCARSTI